MVYKNNIDYIYNKRSNSARYFFILYSLELSEIRLLEASNKKEVAT